MSAWPSLILFALVYRSQSGELLMNGRLQLEECYGSEVTIPRLRLRNLANISSNRNVDTCFLGTQSLVHVRVLGMVAFMIGEYGINAMVLTKA